MDFEQMSLFNELTQGREVTNMLMKHLHPCSSHETRQVLLDKILCSYEKALSILNCNAIAVETKPTVSSSETPPSNEVYDVFKKRKTSSGWTEQIRVSSGASLDNPLEDGYCWRKYGQKAILGSNYPRGYYRCTYRHSQGCLAIKQVQRSDDDHSIFDVKYRGRHTCKQASHFAATFVPTDSKDNKGNQYCKRQQQFEDKQEQEQRIFSSFQSGLKVKTEDLDNREDIFPSYSFAIESEEVKNGSFVEALMENDIMGDLSQVTSKSNYFSVSPCHMGSFESNLTDIISAQTSVTNSPIGDLDISSLDKLEFDPTFSFDNLEFFS